MSLVETVEEFLYLILETAVSIALLVVVASMGADLASYLKLIDLYIKNDIKNMINLIRICGCYIIY